MTDTRRSATFIITLCVALAVAAGLFINGGPGRARKEGRDDDRLRQLQQISANIRCQAEALGRVPDAPQTTDLCPTPFALQNPETGEAYTYIRVDDRNWRLCAAFELPARIRTRDGAQFDAGHGCLLGTLTPRQLPNFVPMDQFVVIPRD